MTFTFRFNILDHNKEIIRAIRDGKSVEYSLNNASYQKFNPSQHKFEHVIGWLSDPEYTWRIKPIQYRKLTTQEMVNHIGCEVLFGEAIRTIQYIGDNNITFKETQVPVLYETMKYVPRYSDGKYIFRKEIN